MAKLSEYLKSILLIVILLQLIPLLISSMHKYYQRVMEPKSKVGVVTLTEEIRSTGTYAKQVRKFFKDPEIKAIVLHIDSPGGSSGSSQALFHEINELKKEYVKPVIAFTENFCASGAFYIACAADHIIAQPSTLIGGIGAYIGFPSFAGLLDQIKVKYNTVESGKFKGAGTYFKDLSPEQRTMLQSLTDDTYAQFVEDVIRQRPKLATVPPSTWAEGKLFTGRQALALGLVDELGPQAALIRALKARAPIEGDIEWVHPPQEGMLTTLFGAGKDGSDFDVDGYAPSLLRWGTRAVVELINSAT